MANYNKKLSDTGLRLGEVRFSYANVFVPRASDLSKDEKYSVCVLVQKGDKQIEKLFNDAVEAAKTIGIAGKWGGKRPSGLKIPTLRDGDEEHPDDEAFKGMWFFNASSRSKPGVAVLANGRVTEALGEEDFYSGCYGAVTVNFYPFNSGANGVACGLNNVIKTRDGDRFSGGSTAEEDFGDLGGAGELD